MLVAVTERLDKFSHASVSTAMDWHYAMVRAHRCCLAVAASAPPFVC